MQFPSYSTFEWIVVDNQSNDDGKVSILGKFPFVIWIDMGSNSGFARANNQGIRTSSKDVVLLLNPDTIVVDDAIQKCYNRFINSDYVASGVQLLNPDGTPQITGNFFMTGGLNHLLPLPYMGPILRKIAFGLKTKKTNVVQAVTEQKVDWINGAFLMVKKTAIEIAGLLDEDFFLYSEEIEWCSRLRKIGELCVYGDLNTVHLVGGTINTSTNTSDITYFNIYDRKGLQLMVSNHVRIRKQFGIGWFLFHLFMHSIEIPVFFVCLIIDNIIHGNNPAKNFSKLRQYTGNVIKLLGQSLTIISNKPHFYKIL